MRGAGDARLAPKRRWVGDQATLATRAMVGGVAVARWREVTERDRLMRSGTREEGWRGQCEISPIGRHLGRQSRQSRRRERTPTGSRLCRYPCRGYRTSPDSFLLSMGEFLLQSCLVLWLTGPYMHAQLTQPLGDNSVIELLLSLGPRWSE